MIKSSTPDALWPCPNLQGDEVVATDNSGTRAGVMLGRSPAGNIDSTTRQHRQRLGFDAFGGNKSVWMTDDHYQSFYRVSGDGPDFVRGMTVAQTDEYWFQMRIAQDREIVEMDTMEIEVGEE